MPHQITRHAWAMCHVYRAAINILPMAHHMVRHGYVTYPWRTYPCRILWCATPKFF
jgi:hypothetical protein